jgi:hypothetical protein
VRTLRLLGATVIALMLAAGSAPARIPPPDAYATSAPAPPPDDGQGTAPGPTPEIAWAHSRALGVPWSGRLVDGVQLPEEGPDWFTWDAPAKRSPSRGWRRWGTDALVRTTLRVLREYREVHPWAPRVGIGDLSRPRGGEFGKRFGGLGHASHQNGLDVDVWYPREDGLERRPIRVSQVDVGLAQALVDGFVEAGAEKVFVGPRLPLEGPPGVVVALVHHDDHLHARIPPPPR